MIRLFVALLIPEKIKDKIINCCNDAAGNSAVIKWEAKEKIHLTLKFIGDVKEEFLPRIIEEIQIVKKYSSFDCKISKFGFFFRESEPKILWCDFETNKSIFSLVDELDERLSKFNIKSEKRKFKGHLTLLRIKKMVDQKFVKRFKEYKFDLINFESNQIALIQSTLNPTGSEYKVLKIYELK